jgi:hypothetical protein
MAAPSPIVPNGRPTARHCYAARAAIAPGGRPHRDYTLSGARGAVALGCMESTRLGSGAMPDRRVPWGRWITGAAPDLSACVPQIRPEIVNALITIPDHEPWPSRPSDAAAGLPRLATETPPGNQSARTRTPPGCLRRARFSHTLTPSISGLIFRFTCTLHQTYRKSPCFIALAAVADFAGQALATGTAGE